MAWGDSSRVSGARGLRVATAPFLGNGSAQNQGTGLPYCVHLPTQYCPWFCSLPIRNTRGPFTWSISVTGARFRFRCRDRPAETPATAGTLFGARPLHAHEADVQLTRPAMSSNLQTSSNGVARNAVPSIATRRCSAPLRLRPRRTGLLGTARPRCTPPRRSFLTNAVTQSHGTPLGCHARKPRLIDSDPPPCIHSHDPECTPRGKRSRSVVSCKP